MAIATSLNTEGDNIPLWFKVPETFMEINPDESVEDRIQRIATSAGRVVGSTPDWQAHAALAHEALIKNLAQIDATYAAIFTSRSETLPARLISALFTVIIRDAPEITGHTMATIAHGLREPGGRTETLLVDYPAGEACVHGEQHLIRWNNQEQTARQAQTIFRLPDDRRIAILGITSSCLDDWEDLVGLLDDICHTVTFTDPADTPTSIGGILDGGL